MYMKGTIPRSCPRCKVNFLAPKRDVSKGWATFCSRKCAKPSYTDDSLTLEIVMKSVDVGETPDSCWTWTGRTNRDGYGEIGGRQLTTPMVHRIVWRLVNGSIPASMKVLHRCDNPPCCRPDHLFLGTTQENVADMVSKGRQSRGMSRPNVKLSDEHVRQIRMLLQQGVCRKDIARIFGVCRSTVGHIATRRQWSHVV